MSRFALGTVQFGLDYGVTNRHGKVSESVASSIIGAALRAGIHTFDTAIAYGDAETSLGKALRENQVASPSIVTKLPPGVDVLSIGRDLADSRQKLGRPKLHGVMFHHAASLLGDHGPQLWQALEREQEHGEIQKIGVSVYRPDELAAILSRFPVQIVQVPYNVFNQDFALSGMLERLKERSVEVHARSIFLQGALLNDWRQLPSSFAPHAAYFERFGAELRRTGLSALEYCVSLALGNPLIDYAVVGVTSADELQQIVSTKVSTNLKDAVALACADERLTNPALWPKA